MFPPNPSPVRAHARSPIRGPSPFAPSTAKGKGKALGQDASGVAPKQMFKDLMARGGPSSKGLATQTPARRALGDKTNNASPGTLGGRGRDQDAGGSPTKKSPTKQASGSRQQSSPAKSVKTSPTKSRSRSPSKRQHEAAIADASYLTTATPAPAELGGRRLSRVPSFVTPAQNIGKAGAIKARLGEMMDRMQGNDVDGEMDEGQMGDEAAMTEEQLYPEIEYMAPSQWAKNPPYEPPLELADLPTGTELGAMLSNVRCGGFYRPRTSSHPEAPEHTLRGPSPELFQGEQEGSVEGLQVQDVERIREEERRELFGHQVRGSEDKPLTKPTMNPSTSALKSTRPASAAGSAVSSVRSRPTSSASSVRPKPSATSNHTPLARLALGGGVARPVNRPTSAKTSTGSVSSSRPASSASSVAVKSRPAAKGTMPPPSRPLATKASNGPISAKPNNASKPKQKATDEKPDRLDVWLNKKEKDLVADSLGDAGFDIDEDMAGLL